MNKRTDKSQINRTLDTLLSSRSRIRVSSNILSITQTYFDALCDLKKAAHNRGGRWADQKYILEKLLTACEMAICGYVLDDKSDINTAKWFVQHVMDGVSYYTGNKKLRKNYHFKPQNAMKYAETLKNLVEREKIDLTIFIAPSGIMPAAALMYYTKKYPIGIKYARLPKVDKNIFFPQNMYITEFKELIKNKKVLIVDGVLENTEVAAAAIKFIVAFRPKQLYLSTEGPTIKKVLRLEREY
jgi:hypothetical protein